MSVAYEPRSFISEGAYPSMGDDHDHHHEQRYTDNDVAEQLSHYTRETSMLPDETDVLGDDRVLLVDEPHTTVVDDATQLEDLTVDAFPSPLRVASLPPPSLPDPASVLKSESPREDSPTLRPKGMAKPDRDVSKQDDGKFHCPLPDCKEDVQAFSRKCEWNKHMDKHERPYRCMVEGCENLPGFTYSGGLLRHEREVHGKHGGPKKTVNCPHPNCKRHTGKGFSRQENLNEHLRRVHTNPDAMLDGSPPETTVQSPDGNESEMSGTKRKRRLSDDGLNQVEELTKLRDEMKRVRDENDKLKHEMEQQSQNSLAMMAQIAELQDALRHGLANGVPTAQMI